VSTPDRRPDPEPPRGFAARIPDWTLERATGASRVDGNAIRLQFDGPYTFDAWIEAIDGARDYIHFENYIIRDDRVGRVFRDALVSKALQGVEVRVLYDWIGCWATRRRYWKPYREAGVEVRAFNPPSLRDPFGMLQRDHRKMVCVDGTLAFIGGFCVGKEWAGDGEHPPWRDTGVEIEGPAAAVCSRAFERIWGQVGEPVPVGIQSDPSRIQPAGETPVWIIEGEPWRSRVYRETQLVAASAQERIWITDPYFVAPFPVAEALTAAARDGVDVRVLLPAHNNWPWVGSLSRGGYRGLLEAGVRIFEWQGPMIHAKTMVADGVWSRIGSSNLNSASLLGNWEIDAGSWMSLWRSRWKGSSWRTSLRRWRSCFRGPWQPCRGRREGQRSPKGREFLRPRPSWIPGVPSMSVLNGSARARKARRGGACRNCSGPDRASVTPWRGTGRLERRTGPFWGLLPPWCWPWPDWRPSFQGSWAGPSPRWPDGSG
jgi:phosphatidylserine/phosphatidylglycerophosphate/cardiolipin synthase-like enzyme